MESVCHPGPNLLEPASGPGTTRKPGQRSVNPLPMRSSSFQSPSVTNFFAGHFPRFRYTLSVAERLAMIGRVGRHELFFAIRASKIGQPSCFQTLANQSKITSMFPDTYVSTENNTHVFKHLRIQKNIALRLSFASQESTNSHSFKHLGIHGAITNLFSNTCDSWKNNYPVFKHLIETGG